MKLALVLYSTDAETLWNAFRLGIFARQAGDKVQVFLLARGVEAEQHATPPYDVKAKMQEFVTAGGEILACGTCLEARHRDGNALCPLSTMQDLYNMIRAADKVVTL